MGAMNLVWIFVICTCFMNIKCVDYIYLHTRDIIIIDLYEYRYRRLALSLPEFLSYSEITQSPCYTIYFYDFLIEKLILLSHENYEDDLYNNRPKIEGMPSASYALYKDCLTRILLRNLSLIVNAGLFCVITVSQPNTKALQSNILVVNKFYKTCKWDIVVTFGGKQSLAQSSLNTASDYAFNPIPILEVLLEWIPSHLIFLNDISNYRPERSDWKNIVDVLKNPAYNRFHHHPKAEIINCASHKKIHIFNVFKFIFI